MDVSVLQVNNALSNAIAWIVSLLLGSAGRGLAVLAIAVLGMLMLSGRLSVRRGSSIVFGCFLLFSARSVADGLLGTASASAYVDTSAMVAPEAAYETSKAKAVRYDPYAGASVPRDHPEQSIFR